MFEWISENQTIITALIGVISTIITGFGATNLERKKGLHNVVKEQKAEIAKLQDESAKLATQIKNYISEQDEKVVTIKDKPIFYFSDDSNSKYCLTCWKRRKEIVPMVFYEEGYDSFKCTNNECGARLKQQ